MRDGWAKGVRGGRVRPSSDLTPYGLRYHELRARGLCGQCGKVSSFTARCEACARRLSERRYGRRDAAGIPYYGPPPASLEAIAATLGVSKQRIQQVIDGAVEKIADRLHLTRADVLRGLAILGCLGGEREGLRFAAPKKWAHEDDR